MKMMMFLLLVIFISRSSAQDSRGSLYERDLREDLRLSLTVVTDDKNVIRSGLLVDFFQDSVKIFSNNKETAIHINNIRRIDFMGTSSPHKWTLAGFFGGAYLGQLLLFSGEGQKGSYRLRTDENFWAYLLNLVIASAAGAMGYVAGDAGGDNKKTFIFAGDIEKERRKFLEFISEGNESKERVNITVQAGSVNTKFEKLIQKSFSSYSYYYDGYNVSSFNLLRKFQITYAINDYISTGIALNWITEPDINWYTGNYYTNNTSGTQMLDGTGYYAAVELRPLVKLMPEILIFSIGVMGGVMNLDYKSTFQGYATPPDLPPTRTTTISKSSLSGGIYGSLGLRFNNALSISIAGDFLYVPGESTAIPEINLESLPFSTSSIGFSVGFFF